jgi:hypothetical protein
MYIHDTETSLMAFTNAWMAYHHVASYYGISGSPFRPGGLQSLVQNDRPNFDAQPPRLLSQTTPQLK